MAAQDKVTFRQDLTEPVKIRHYEGVVFTGDDCGNLIKVALFDGGVPYSGGGTVSATAVLADGTTFPLTQGSITGNMVSVPLEAGALAVSGLMGLYVKISGDGIICTVLNAIFTVQATDTGMVPAAMVTTVNELVAAIRDAQDSIPADLTNLLAAVAPTFSTSTAYSAGAYVWHGGKLYRFTAAHPAGTWTGTDAVEVALGNDVADLKSALNNIQNTENLYNSSATSQGRLDTTGKFASVEGYFTSDYIPVEVGTKYCKNSPVIDAYHRICAYATNTSATGRVVSDSNYITIQTGENFVRFCGLAAEKDTAQLYRVTAIDEIARAASANVPNLTADVSALKTAVGYGFKRTTDITTDLNTAGDGWTRVTATTLNAPEPYGGFVMTASRADSSKIQIFVTNDIDYGTHPARIYVRYMRLGTWKAWAMPEFDTFTNGTDYSGDLNSFDKGVARVSASATNNPTGALGYAICIKRAETARMQLFVSQDGAIYARTQASGTWGEWHSDAEGYNLSGKNGYTFGDSIMAQDGLAFSTHYTQNAQYNLDKLSQICKGYQSWLREKYGVTITDYAVGGQGINAQLPIIKAQDYTNVDFVIISTGTNDYSGARTMGTLPTSADAVLDETTFIGAYCSALKYIKTQKPEAKIILMTPLHRDTKWRNDGQPDFSKSATDIFTQNSKGLRLVDYRNAIIQIGELFSCVVCDMYANAGLNLYDLPTYTFEGVHPTNEGYAYIVPVLFKAFEKS